MADATVTLNLDADPNCDHVKVDYDIDGVGTGSFRFTKSQLKDDTRDPEEQKATVKGNIITRIRRLNESNWDTIKTDVETQIFKA